MGERNQQGKKNDAHGARELSCLFTRILSDGLTTVLGWIPNSAGTMV
jgi:hypothetical protein